MWRAFHGQAGVARIVDDAVAHYETDPRIADIFRGQDLVRLKRLLKEQFCDILNGGCAYTGRDMGALVEGLQAAMGREGVGFAAKNRLLAKLAPMKWAVVKR